MNCQFGTQKNATLGHSRSILPIISVSIYVNICKCKELVAGGLEIFRWKKLHHRHRRCRLKIWKYVEYVTKLSTIMIFNMALVWPHFCRQHPAGQQGLSTFLMPSPLADSSLLTAKANFSPLYSPPSSLSPPLYCSSSSTSPPLDPSTYLQLPHGLPTVLPSGLILASAKPKGSHKSYSEKRRLVMLEKLK